MGKLSAYFKVPKLTKQIQDNGVYINMVDRSRCEGLFVPRNFQSYSADVTRCCDDWIMSPSDFVSMEHYLHQLTSLP